MTFDGFIEECKIKIMNNENKKGNNIKKEDAFIVWSCKTLQNYKTIASAKNEDANLYEFTYNGNRKEIYMDVYKKIENRKFIYE